MDAIAFALAVVLTIVSVIHFAWALGMVWPGIDDASLSRIVVGTPAQRGCPRAGSPQSSQS
ncbi:MAG: hypothetical protein ACR2PF_20025 [Rhizobiaceae bacterium]